MATRGGFGPLIIPGHKTRKREATSTGRPEDAAREAPQAQRGGHPAKSHNLIDYFNLGAVASGICYMPFEKGLLISLLLKAN
jgi:hypothetical protein